MRMAASRLARGAHPISFPLDLHDGQLDVAGRPADAHRVALLLTEERAPQRRLVADAAKTKVLGKLVPADDLVGGLLTVLVLHGDRRAEEGAPHRLPGGGVDHLERLEHLLQPVDLRVDLPQLALAQLVLVVLAAIAVRRGHRDLVGNARTFLVEEPAELLAEPLESRPGNVLLHGFLLPEPCGTGNFAACRPRSPRASASP